MTTIAFDGKTLAVDSMTSNDSFVTSRTAQKMWRDVGDFQCVVMAGHTCHYAPVIDWLRKGADPLQWGGWDAVAWAVSGQTIVRYVGGYPETVKGIDGDGSGAEIALGAMAAGATATEAVEIASRYDLYTGGAVHAFTL